MEGMSSETKGWLGTVAGATIFLTVFAFTGSACQQAQDKLITERFTSCVSAGGTWVPGKDSLNSSCVAKER